MKFLIIYPGSFNPLHEGHLAIAQWAEKYYAPKSQDDLASVYFDVARNAYGKNAISKKEFKQRKQAILDLGRPTYTTNERSFLKKEWVIRNNEDTWFTKHYIYFLVGIDTAERIDSIAYYYNSQVEKDLTLESFNERTKFIVFPRFDREYKKENFSPAFNKMVIVPEGFVPVNVSSTELRSKE